MEIQGVALEIWIAALVAVLALLVWGLKRYQVIAADGKVTLDEIIDTLTGVEAPLDEAVENVEKLEAALVAAKEAQVAAEAAEALAAEAAAAEASTEDATV